jgi:DNA-binding transcriptional LysR family regulator
MELRQLRSFIAVAEELHFSRAANRLHLAQSALSRQIQGLEQELKFQLFFRTKRRVQLTSAGTVFLEQARRIFAQLNEGVETAARVAHGRTGWLSVGFVGGATYDVLPAIVRAFRQRSPEVELTLSEMTTTEQLDALREKRVHIGFVRPPVSDEGLALETIMHEPIAVALPRGHRLARRRDIPLRALAREPFILFPHNPKARWGEYMVSLCRQAGFEPKIVQKASEIQTAISLVSAGLGITLVPASVKNIPRKQVVFRQLAEPNPGADLIAAYRHDDPSPVLRDFLLTVRETTRKT